MKRDHPPNEPIEPDRLIALKVWWALTWKAYLLSFVIVFILGIFLSLIIGLMAAKMGMTIDDIEILSNVLVTIVWLCVFTAVSIEVMRRTLKKKFEDFKIVILPRID